MGVVATHARSSDRRSRSLSNAQWSDRRRGRHGRGRTDDGSGAPGVGSTAGVGVSGAEAAVRPTLVLASASPRRSELLTTLGLDVSIRPADVDESVLDGEAPVAYVERVARAKAAAVAAPGTVVIAADTTVVLDGEILGKPADGGAARAMLAPARRPDQRGADRRGRRRRRHRRVAARVSSTTVTFSPITGADIDWYVATGEPLDKAGSYGIQGAGGLFVTRIDGSYQNVVGLPLDVLRALVADLGFDLLDWAR